MSAQQTDGYPAPTCPHCGEPAPYGDERLAWLNWHAYNPIHRWWWKIKKAWWKTHA